MAQFISILLAAIASYLIGAIPTAYLFGKHLKGIDIREHGSGNIGATNAFRVLGKKPGTIVLIIDILKGLIPTTLLAYLFGLDNPWGYVFLGLITVAGHNWTVFLQFKGGKGIATSLGVLIGLTIQISTFRPVLLITLLTWIVVFLVTGYVSLASILASTVLPLMMVVFIQPFAIVLLGIFLCIFIVFRHRPNIKRLFSGTEPKANWPFKRTPY